jgi:hypothetical protein
LPIPGTHGLKILFPENRGNIPQDIPPFPAGWGLIPFDPVVFHLIQTELGSVTLAGNQVAGISMLMKLICGWSSPVTSILGVPDIIQDRRILPYQQAGQDTSNGLDENRSREIDLFPVLGFRGYPSFFHPKWIIFTGSRVTTRMITPSSP